MNKPKLYSLMILSAITVGLIAGNVTPAADIPTYYKSIDNKSGANYIWGNKRHTPYYKDRKPSGDNPIEGLEEKHVVPTYKKYVKDGILILEVDGHLFNSMGLEIK